MTSHSNEAYEQYVGDEAVAGSPRETGDTLHRIDSAIVVADMPAAGKTVTRQTATWSLY